MSLKLVVGKSKFIELKGEADYVNISELVKDFNHYLEEGFTHLKWGVIIYHEKSAALEVRVVSLRNETEAEYQKRIILEEKQLMQQEREYRDFLYYKKRYEELKSKYEQNS